MTHEKERRELSDTVSKLEAGAKREMERHKEQLSLLDKKHAADVLKSNAAHRMQAERELAVAKAHTEATQQQAAERAKALETEQQARRDDANAHKLALAEQRDEWKERLAITEKQVQEARQQAQEAEKGKTKAEVRGEALAARLEVLESQKTA